MGSEALRRSLLLGNSEGLAGSASGLGVLTLDLEAEVVTETSVLADLLHALQVFSESGVDHVGVQLAPGAVLDAALSVQEPLGDVVVERVGENVTNSVHFFFSELACSAAQINLGNFASEGAESAANTLDTSKRKRDLLLSIHVCVLHSQNVLEVVSFSKNKCRLQNKLAFEYASVIRVSRKVLALLSSLLTIILV